MKKAVLIILAISVMLLTFVGCGLEGKGREPEARDAAMAELIKYYGDHFEYVKAISIEKGEFDYRDSFMYMLTFRDTNEPEIEFPVKVLLGTHSTYLRVYPQYKEEQYRKAYGEYIIETFQKYCPGTTVIVAPEIGSRFDFAYFSPLINFDGVTLDQPLKEKPESIGFRPKILVIYEDDEAVENGFKALYESEKWIVDFEVEDYVNVSSNCIMTKLPKDSPIRELLNKPLVREQEFMDLISAIEKRRSIRKFLDKGIDINTVKEIIRLGTLAPTACNRQGWRFIIITDKEIMTKIKNKGGAIFIPNAPLGILILYNKFTNNLEYPDNVQSASACIDHMLLAATNYGLATCWINDLPKKSYLHELFKIPSRYDIIAYVVLGHPAYHLKAVPRKYSDIDEVISYNKFDMDREIEKRRIQGKLSLTIVRTLKNIYHSNQKLFDRILPKIILNKLRKRFGTEKHEN